jgi:hypothetical protein
VVTGIVWIVVVAVPLVRVEARLAAVLEVAVGVGGRAPLVRHAGEQGERVLLRVEQGDLVAEVQSELVAEDVAGEHRAGNGRHVRLLQRSG